MSKVPHKETKALKAQVEELSKAKGNASAKKVESLATAVKELDKVVCDLLDRVVALEEMSSIADNAESVGEGEGEADTIENDIN